MINKTLREELKNQALQEIQFARTYKQGMLWRWQKNEDMYYATKYTSVNTETDKNIPSSADTKANVELGKMQSFVHTVLSKIDSPLTFKFKSGSMADLKRAKLLNALKEKDSNLGDWNFKDLVGKKQAILYGRAIYSYYADSIDGYASHLENVDIYDFLIDPSAGGVDLDRAMYLGRYGIRRNKEELKKGMKDGTYLKEETKQLLNGSGDLNNQTTQEDTNKQNRYSYVGSPYNRTMENPSVYKFWEWYTTGKDGKRYYLLLSEDFATVIRVELLSDLFKIDEKLGDAMYPFWSWSCFPDLTEFWTPSYADYVREIFMAQSTSINQMLEGAERVIKPQRAVDVNAIENLNDLVYRRNGIIRMKSGADINKAFQQVITPSIETPLAVYDKLETIQQLESGVTAGVKGDAEEDKVGIYEGNLAQSADRFGLLNKTYSQGYKRFARLYENGVNTELTKKVAVKILGPKGYEKTVFISKRDVKPQEAYDVLVESSNAEAQSDTVDKKNKLVFLSGYKGDPMVNQKVLFEKTAEYSGLSSEEVRTLLDTSEYGEADQISEAERDIEDLINQKIIEPNQNATVAYAKHIIEYMKDHREDMSEDVFMLFTDYLERLEPVVIDNMGTQFMEQSSKINNKAVEEMEPLEEGQTPEQLETNEPNGENYVA